MLGLVCLACSSPSPGAPNASEPSDVAPDPTSDRVGEELAAVPAWELGPWDGHDPVALEDWRGCVVVVRFWTDTCPYCEKSLPALADLAKQLQGAPVRFVGAYHSKPRGTERPFQEAVELARTQWGVRFPIAYDREWRTVDAWWLSRGERRATSASFVIGPGGDVRHVHPGPVFFPSHDPEHAKENGDFEALRRAIDEAAAQASGCD